MIGLVGTRMEDLLSLQEPHPNPPHKGEGERNKAFLSHDLKTYQLKNS